MRFSPSSKHNRNIVVVVVGYLGNISRAEVRWIRRHVMPCWARYVDGTSKVFSHVATYFCYQHVGTQVSKNKLSSSSQKINLYSDWLWATLCDWSAPPTYSGAHDVFSSTFVFTSAVNFLNRAYTLYPSSFLSCEAIIKQNAAKLPVFLCYSQQYNQQHNQRRQGNEKYVDEVW